jgi:FPC/CPF motif-containing protein YcgG/NTP pyrophosphatase (non-canonical NTP hydrolase)
MIDYIDRHLSERQQHVAHAIAAVGGYWHPIAAVARILEELGEYAELISFAPDDSLSRSSSNAIAEELADLWIITTCIANQFCITIPDSYGPELDTGEVPRAEILGQLLAQAGMIARIVSYYDGPKKPGSLRNWICLDEPISLFQHHLRRLAELHSIDLDRTVDSKLDLIAIRDKGRFDDAFDPSTAASLESFQTVVNETACSFARNAHLWGAPAWNSAASIRENAAIIAPYLISFTKCAQYEGLDSFIIQAKGEFLSDDMPAISRSFNSLLHALVEIDPTENDCLETRVDRLGWQFVFNQVRIFITVFSSIYQQSSPRYCSTGTYIMLQPETSFDKCSIGRAYPQSAATKVKIRNEFARQGFDYPADLIDQRIEASLYILPREANDKDCEWWRF